METPVINNGVELLQHLFAVICKTAPAKEVSRDGDDWIVAMHSGRNEGQFVRLSYSQESISLEFHHSKWSASDPTHTQDAFHTLDLVLKQMQYIDDKQRGRLFEQDFHTKVKFGGFMRLRRCDRNTSYYLVSLINLMDCLPCEYIWQSEIDASRSRDLSDMIGLANNVVPAESHSVA